MRPLRCAGDRTRARNTVELWEPVEMDMFHPGSNNPLLMARRSEPSRTCPLHMRISKVHCTKHVMCWVPGRQHGSFECSVLFCPCYSATLPHRQRQHSGCLSGDDPSLVSALTLTLTPRLKKMDHCICSGWDCFYFTSWPYIFPCLEGYWLCTTALAHRDRRILSADYTRCSKRRSSGNGRSDHLESSPK